MGMIAEKWKPVFGNEHAPVKMGEPMADINGLGR
jgi:hypothetical protein